jgi:homocysteine S-methyltransferase
MTSTLLSRLLARPRPILADGAMGTMLHARGISFDECFDELNLSRPELILAIHKEYLLAGAEVLETNTFGANRFKLGHHGLAGRVAEVNASAAALARLAAAEAGREVLVAGSIGPLGVRLAPTGRVPRQEALRAYVDQATALVAAGADLILIETQIDPDEALLAIEAARRAGPLPIAASLTFPREALAAGETPARALSSLKQAGAAIVGANCSQGPDQLAQMPHRLAKALGTTPISLMPNAGWPEEAGGRIMYPASPLYFGEFAAAMTLHPSVRILGGCCGTTPDHIAAMSQAITRPASSSVKAFGSRPGRRAPPAAARSASGRAARPVPTGLASGLAERRFLLCLEYAPPRGFLTDRHLAEVRRYHAAGADVINVADSPLARMRMSPWAVCHRIQSELGVDTVLHFPTRGRNLLRVQGDLLAAHALGVRNVFVVMGDPPSVGDYPEAMGNYDLAPSGLIRLIKRGFNAGADHAGADLGGRTAFFVGCALDLAAADLQRELMVLHRKVSAGADFALTQPLFEPAALDWFLEEYGRRYGRLELPLLVGMLPLQSERHAQFLDNEVPGIRIPSPILQRLRQAADPARTGIDIAVETLEAVRDKASGVYLIPPASDSAAAVEILTRARRSARPLEARDDHQRTGRP